MLIKQICETLLYKNNAKKLINLNFSFVIKLPCLNNFIFIFLKYGEKTEVK